MTSKTSLFGNSKELQLRTCNYGEPHARLVKWKRGNFCRGEGEVGKGCYLKKNTLEETGSLKFSDFSLAVLWQSLNGWVVARPREILPFLAGWKSSNLLDGDVRSSLPVGSATDAER